MVEGRQKVVLKDFSGNNLDVIFEINWNSFTSSKGWSKITVGDKTVVLDKNHLWSILFMLGNEKEQQEMLSRRTKMNRVRKHMRVIGVKTTRKVEKGELINIALDFTYNPEKDSLTIGKGNNSLSEN